jgi:hypothetical protein
MGGVERGKIREDQMHDKKRESVETNFTIN